VDPGLPSGLAGPLDALFASQPQAFTRAAQPDAADAHVTLELQPTDTVIAEWVYAVVAPFPTLVDGVAWSDLVACWQGTPGGPFASRPLLAAPDTVAVLARILGEPAPGAVETVAEGEILQRAWDVRPAWAIVPFEQLEPRWKVLRVDGHSVLDRAMDVTAYPLVVRVGARSGGAGVDALRRALGATLTNRDPRRLAVVMMTGVTALTRGTAMRMDTHGPAYPGQDIRPWLVEPDVTHVSSEVSFAADCPPQTSYTTLTFCSDPRYIELLESLDIDVVELTGNHLLDWGVEAMVLSLQMYDERAIPYFGGGWNVAQAQAPLTLTVGSQTFGFIGCNPAGPRSDWATEDRPGSAPCDYERLTAQVHGMRDAGIIPIVTLQYREYDQYEPTPQQRADFRALAEAGAAIVSGSQAHQPQGFDFHAGAFIHYGLGNLFFDQMWSLETRQEFLDRHVFYDGRHVSTEVLTAILEDYARPRPMSEPERAALLQAAFAASGW
jgi:poly-gamma-glutamate synthesis protein (capsule biosynthesis protein)